MSFIARNFVVARTRPIVQRYAVASSSQLLAGPSSRCYSAKMPESDVAPARKAKHTQSIMPAGTIMKDLSILKDTPDPIALPDSDYPAWLWTLTDESLASSQAGKKAAELDAEGGMALEDAREGLIQGKTFDHKAERRKLRSSNKAEIKARNFLRTT